MTKYWRGNPGSPKEGFCGSMADNGFVPDSIDISQAEYQAWHNAQPGPTPDPAIAEYAAAGTDSARIAVLARKLRLIA